MANEKISQKAAAATLTGAEIVPLVQDGVTVRATVDEIAARAPATDISGKEDANANIQEHIAATGNPHGMTALEIGFTDDLLAAISGATGEAPTEANPFVTRSTLGYAIPVTYEQLLALKNAGTLVPGVQYMITDQQCIKDLLGRTWYGDGILLFDQLGNPLPDSVRYTNPTVEPLVVKASSTTTLRPQARSVLHPNDIIIYELESSPLATGQYNPKGRITYREEPGYRDIKCHWDWRYQINVLHESVPASGQFDRFGYVITGTTYTDETQTVVASVSIDMSVAYIYPTTFPDDGTGDTVAEVELGVDGQAELQWYFAVRAFEVFAKMGGNKMVYLGMATNLDYDSCVTYNYHYADTAYCHWSACAKQMTYKGVANNCHFGEYSRGLQFEGDVSNCKVYQGYTGTEYPLDSTTSRRMIPAASNKLFGYPDKTIVVGQLDPDQSLDLTTAAVVDDGYTPHDISSSDEILLRGEGGTTVIPYLSGLQSQPVTIKAQAGYTFTLTGTPYATITGSDVFMSDSDIIISGDKGDRVVFQKVTITNGNGTFDVLVPAVPAAPEVDLTGLLDEASHDLLDHTGLPGVGAGGGGDMLSDTAAEVAITDNATLDSTAFGKWHSVTITAADKSIGLPPAAGNAGKWIGLRIAAASTKLAHICLSDGVAKTGTVTGGSSVFSAGTGTIAATTSTAIVGTGTSFTTQLRPGDRVICVNGAAFYVAAIADNTHLTASAAVTVAGSFNFIQTGLAGSSTAFSTDYTVGNGIIVGGVARTVAYINGAGVMAVDAPFLSAPTAAAYALTTANIGSKFGAHRKVLQAGEATIIGCDGTNYYSVSYQHVPMQNTLAISANQSVTAGSVLQKVLFNTTISDIGNMSDLTNNLSRCRRSSIYDVTWFTQWASLAVTVRALLQMTVNMNASAGGGSEISNYSAGAYPTSTANITTVFSENNFFNLFAYHNNAGTQNLSGESSGGGRTLLTIKENPAW